ncbi:hypothetical protein RJ639_045287 [Escallonia herrerae]|uniref:Uncharacterized protein n=1 Tax=Escallonia herrerae TaxID=1293975 RepID=A0AA88W9W6_9ASTE|nr:hypothetical protein RJ639_045287 [Escallonia herrerae]
MGVSFKVSKRGTRFRPKPLPSETSVLDEEGEDAAPTVGPISTSDKKLVADVTDAEENAAGISDTEVSFTVDLFPDGYSIGKPSENETVHQATLQDVPKFLRPYDRTAETLFSAIESGRLPGDILDDIPCKYVDGTLVCEVRDYRKCAAEPGLIVPSTTSSPFVNKVRLRMSLENVVKDIPLISDNAWTYGDLMEVESRILKALQPQLCLDPTPKLDRLCSSPVSPKLNLALPSLRRKRLCLMPEVTVTSNNKIHGKKVCIDRVPESSQRKLGDSRPLMQQPIHENLTTQKDGLSNMLASKPKSFAPDASSAQLSPLVSLQSKYQMGVEYQRNMQDRSGSVLQGPGASPAAQDIINSYGDNMNSSNSSNPGKRENQDGPLSPLSSLNKRTRITSAAPDGSQQQHIGGFHVSDLHWKNSPLQQQQIARGMQYANIGMQKYPQQLFEGGFNQDSGAMPFNMGQQGIRYGLREEQIEIERMDKPKSEMLPQQIMRSSFHQSPWNNLGQALDSNSRKEDQYQKRKLVQSPRISAGGFPQSPLSSKSGEFSSGSIGPQIGVAATAALGSSQKTAITTVPAVCATTSLTSSANDSMQRQHQTQSAAKRRSNSLPKTPAMSGVGSPASVSNMGVPLNASSPPVGTPPLADQMILERFSKIVSNVRYYDSETTFSFCNSRFLLHNNLELFMSCMTNWFSFRFQPNCKTNKVDEYQIRKPGTHSAQQLMLHLSSDPMTDNFKDETCKMPLSKSLVGGSMNVCKTRVMNFMQTERIPQGNGFSIVPKVRPRMIMSEKPNDGMVAMHYGEIEDGDYLAAEDYLPTLPNTHVADLLAGQFSSLMMREGYQMEDHVQQKPVHMNRASSSQANGIPINTAANELQPNLEAILAFSVPKITSYACGKSTVTIES